MMFQPPLLLLTVSTLVVFSSNVDARTWEDVIDVSIYAQSHVDVARLQMALEDNPLIMSGEDILMLPKPTAYNSRESAFPSDAPSQVPSAIDAMVELVRDSYSNNPLDSSLIADAPTPTPTNQEAKVEVEVGGDGNALDMMIEMNETSTMSPTPDSTMDGSDDLSAPTITPISQSEATPRDLYYDKYWADLPEDIQQAYTILGYTEELWDTGAALKIYDEDWDNMSSEQQQAALQIGYTSDIWNDIALIPTDAPSFSWF